MFNAYVSSPSLSTSLLVSVVVYLASLALPPDPALWNLRTALLPHITCVRDEIMLQLPGSFHALQALDILAMHAPLGALPLQLVNPRSLGVARGQILSINSISESLRFGNLFKTMIFSQVAYAWDLGDAWLYMSLRADEASGTLEDEVTRRPVSLSEVRDVAEAMMANENAGIWMGGLESQDYAGVLGKLAVCDRLARLGQAHDGLSRIREALDAAATEPNLDLVEAVIEELKYYGSRLEAIDSRFEAIVSE